MTPNASLAAPSHAIPSVAAATVESILRCPGCYGTLARTGDALQCEGCSARYPIVRGVPILVHEPRSIFTIDEIIADADGNHGHPPTRGFKAHFLEALPSISKNWRAPENFQHMHALLKARPGRKRVLVIGGGVLGYGMEPLVNDPDLELVETDVFLAPRTTHVVDAHDLPFVDEAFDAVIMQGVLGALLDPNRAVAEIVRVLKLDGLVYVETPFVQQVCMGRYDYQRYSHLGLRRMFRQFAEEKSGAQAGPGMSLAWAWQYLLWSIAGGRRGRAMMLVVARLTAWWLPKLDGWLLTRPGAYDAASGVFFLGRKTSTSIPDRELLQLYRGGYA
jgi:SAM-dependent methyltransferase